MVQEVSRSLATPPVDRKIERRTSIEKSDLPAPGPSALAERAREAAQNPTEDAAASADLQLTQSPVEIATRLGIQIDRDSGRFVYLSLNPETREIVRQFPTEEELKRLAFFREVRGEIVDEKI